MASPQAGTNVIDLQGCVTSKMFYVSVQVYWRIVKVSGDGDCLFHALAYSEGCDGQALRLDVANFLEERAKDEAGFQEEMQREAEKLRAGRWGGHTAIAGYSHMTQTRIVVRARRVGEGAAASNLRLKCRGLFPNVCVCASIICFAARFNVVLTARRDR